MRSLISISFVASLLGFLALASGASGGVYDVYACGGPAGNSQHAFAAAQDPLMSAYSICPSSTIGTGVVTKSTSSGGFAADGNGAYQIFTAPHGTRLDSVNLRVAEIRMEKHWNVGIVSYNASGVGEMAYGCPAYGFGCDIATPYFVGPVAVNLNGRTHFRVESRCFDGNGCDVSSTGKNPANRALFSVSDIVVHIRDDSEPQLYAYGQGWDGNWHRGTETMTFDARDNVGIRFISFYVDGQLVHQNDYADQSYPPNLNCDYTFSRPCDDIPSGSLQLDAGRLTDGMHQLHLRAVDAAGNTAWQAQTIQVDNTAPSRITSEGVTDGEGWRRINQFDVHWQAPPNQVAPINNVHYSVCAVSSGSCSEAQQAVDSIQHLSNLQVPDTGDYTLRMWLEDAAGNVDRDHASDPLHLRFDDRSPDASFDAPDDADPLAVSTTVLDQDSGVDRATIEIRRQGSHDWQALPTTLNGSHAVTRIDDLTLPDGYYQLRVDVLDRAGNETISSTHADGSHMELRLPLRDQAKIVISAKQQVVSRRCRKALVKGSRRHRKRHSCKPPKNVVTTADGSATVEGHVVNGDGASLANATVAVSERARSGGPVLRTRTITSDSAGRFSYRSAAGPSRTIEFAYPGSALIKPAHSRIDLDVAARTSIAATPLSISNGQSTLFAGRLLGGFVPRGGKLIELQAYFRKRWRTFTTTRARADGRWRYRYRFGATTGLVKYAFRALISAEAAYPFEVAHSRVVRVKVRG